MAPNYWYFPVFYKKRTKMKSSVGIQWRDVPFKSCFYEQRVDEFGERRGAALINLWFMTRQRPRKLTGCVITAAQQYCNTDHTYSGAGIIWTPIKRTCIQNEHQEHEWTRKLILHFLTPEQQNKPRQKKPSSTVWKVPLVKGVKPRGADHLVHWLDTIAWRRDY